MHRWLLRRRQREKYLLLEFQGPTGPFILAPAEGSGWRTQGLASLAGHIIYSNFRVYLISKKYFDSPPPANKSIVKWTWSKWGKHVCVMLYLQVIFSGTCIIIHIMYHAGVLQMNSNSVSFTVSAKPLLWKEDFMEDNVLNCLCCLVGLPLHSKLQVGR